MAAQSGRPGIVACDPAYALAPDALGAAVRRGLAEGSTIIDEHADRFTWRWYGTPAERDRQRRAAADAFLSDRWDRPARYVAASLPRLPFADGCFDLAVVSHLLFTWARELDADWHRAALRGLLRVAAQVRVFPLVLAGSGEPVPFATDLLDELAADGVVVERRRVGYEFQVGGDEALVLRR